jgi:hypothetical protein
MPGSNMYGTPRQTYAVLNNVFYPADGNGLIANVAQADVQALVAQGCMSEAQWLKVQAAHPAGGGLRFMPFFGDTKGRRSEPDQPAAGLPFPPALSLRAGALPARGAGTS